MNDIGLADFINEFEAGEMVDQFEDIIEERFGVPYKYPASERAALILDIRRNPKSIWAFHNIHGWTRMSPEQVEDELIQIGKNRFIPKPK